MANMTPSSDKQNVSVLCCIFHLKDVNAYIVDMIVACRTHFNSFFLYLLSITHSLVHYL